MGRRAAYLEQGERLLRDAAVEALGADTWQKTWDTEHAQSWSDPERFPEWAQKDYEVCVHWEGPYTVKVPNNDRRPGNSAVMLDSPCKAWGWILVGQSGVYFLELAYQCEFSSEPTILIDGWTPPSAPSLRLEDRNLSG